MAPVQARPTQSEPRRRSERLEARVTSEQKALIEHAAALQGRSITDFVLSSVQDAARRAIKDHEVLRLSVADSKKIVEAFLNPRPAAPALREAVARYRTLVAGD